MYNKIINYVKDFCERQIAYFSHDEELQCDWKFLLEIIRKMEVSK